MAINWSNEAKNAALNMLFKGQPTTSVDLSKVLMDVKVGENISIDPAGGNDKTVVAMVQGGKVKAFFTPPSANLIKHEQFMGMPVNIVGSITPAKIDLELDEEAFVYETMKGTKLPSVSGPITEVCTRENPKPKGPSPYSWEHPDRTDHHNKFEQSLRYHCKHCNGWARIPLGLHESLPPEEYYRMVDDIISYGTSE